MDWQEIIKRLRLLKDDFDKSYKCLNLERNIKDETVVKHLRTLFDRFERIRVVVNVNFSKLTTPHKAAAECFFSDVRSRLISILSKKGLYIELPTTFHEEVSYKLTTDQKSNETLVLLYNQETKPEIISTNMTQTIVEFLNTASKLVIDFDGRSENLRAFIDSLQLLNTIKGDNEAIAVSLIKTKLKGTARNLIENEGTILEIISKLRATVKGESVEVLTAKIMNTRQNNKTANNYCSEIENLTKSLESAYISDGLSCELANKYSTQVAVKALTKNCTIDKVKLIMEAGQFNNMNEAITKFVNSCTEATGQQNALLYLGRKYNRPIDRRNNNQYRRKYNNFPNNNINNNFRPPQRPGNNRNRQGFNNRRRNGNYVRATDSYENGSENSDNPLR